MIKQLIELRRIGGFLFDKFQSNRKFVMDCLPTQNNGKSTITFGKDDENIQHTLGIQWEILKHSFNFPNKTKMYHHQSMK